MQEIKFDFEPNIYDIVRVNIKKYRNIRGLTSTQLALYIGIEPESLRKIESTSPKSNSDFSFDTLYKISVVLDTSLDKFVKKD